jgi:acetyltransferase-like isoleucine patch superfamily enzyme
VIYKLKGYKIGKDVKIKFGSVLIGKNVIIGKNASIGFFSILRAEDIKIGKYVTFGSFCFWDTRRIVISDDTRIREQVYVGGLIRPDSEIRIGKRCLIMQNTFMNPTCKIELGDDTAIGGDSLLFTHSSWLSVLDGYPVRFEPIKIGARVWIPWRIFITSGVSIGDDVIIGPDCLVNKDVPSNSMVRSHPFQILPNIYKRKLSVDQKIKTINQILKEFCMHTKESRGSIILESSILDGKTHVFLMYPEHKKRPNPDTVVVIDKADNILDYIEKYKDSVLLFIENRVRYGSTHLGEEVVRFLSRYGIRFERINDRGVND